VNRCGRCGRRGRHDRIIAHPAVSHPPERRGIGHALRDYADLSICQYDGVALLDGIWRLRDTFTVYDAAYLTLASALACPLATSDAKMREAERLGVDVRVYPPAE